jgi:site-specific DNA recombinase
VLGVIASGRYDSGVRLSVAGYARISDDREGLELGVERQQQDLHARWGDELIEVFVDNDISASTRSKKRRPAYEEMMRRAETGEFDVLSFYTTSRLTRRPLEYERLIALHESRGTKLVALQTGEVNLATADGRMTARILAAADAAEAERIGERVSRSHEQLRASGKITGPPPFGYGAGMQVIPEEAAAIRQAVTILLRGGTVGEVVRVWTEAGVKRRRGKHWNHSGVQYALSSAALCGFVPHAGRPAAAGDWTPILTVAEWEAVQQAARPGARSRPGANARSHLLSGFLYCGTCGTLLRTSSPGKYACKKIAGGCGRLSRDEAWLLEAVDLLVRIWLDTYDIGGEAPVEDEAAGEATEIERKISALRGNYEADRIGDEDFYPMLANLRVKLNAAKARSTAAVRKAAVANEDAHAMWEAGTLDERRTLLSQIVFGFKVLPVGRIGRRPPPAESLVPIPRESATS